MWFLYLDESGDLGFDFVNKKPSNFFTVTILAMSSHEADRQIAKAVSVTIRRKLNTRGKRQRIVEELKATKTTLDIKKYFYERIKDIKFGIYSVTLNKRKAYERLTHNKSRTYNFIARKVLDHIPFEKNKDERVQFVIDKSKSKREIAEFDHYMRRHLEGRLNPKTPLNILHSLSNESLGLQAADLFSWGIFQKYEKRKTEWFDMYKNKVLFDEQYL